MDKPDWSKAPAGATHWGPESEDWLECWYRYTLKGWEVYIPEHWEQWMRLEHPLRGDRLDALVAREPSGDIPGRSLANFDGYQVIKSEALPAKTMVVSPDVYELLIRVPKQ